MNKTALRLAARRLMLLAAVLAASAYAQPAQGPQSLDQIMNASPPKDESVAMLNSIIGGNFFVSPLSSIGGATTLLGSMLLIFNGAIFLVAVAWGTYNLLRGIVGTAQDGEILGKQMSTIWMPIRMVTGIVGIVPVFGGFNLAQVILVVCTAIGIGIANMMFQAAVSMTSGFSTLLSPMIVSPTVTAEYRKMVYGQFATEVCYLAKKDKESKDVADGQTLLVGDAIVAMPLLAPGLSSSAFGLDMVPGTLTKYGTPNNRNLCGHVVLFNKPGTNAGATHVLGVALGYQNPAVNYAQVESLVRSGYAAAHQQMVARVRAEAEAWWTARKAAQANAQATPPPAPLENLDALARAYGLDAQRAATQASKGVDQGAIRNSVKTKMEQGGWITLGSWHSAFTEANSAVVDAVSAIKPDVASPSTDDSSSLMAEAVAAFERSVEASRQQSSSAIDKADDVGLIKHLICESLPSALIGVSALSAVGECSVGQMYVKAMIAGAATGSGGGQVTGGSVALVDPIVMFKNGGDWLMTAGSVMLTAAAGAKFLAWAAPDNNSAFGWAANKLTGGGVQKVKEAVGWTAGVLLTLAAGMIFIGGLMSVYIPLVPFITWMGGLIQYFVIFFEGMTAMTLAALAHMESQGEGMGQRSEPGYIFLLNMIARPGLMVLGFVAAAAACIALGTIQVTLFLPAIANSQGNSVTGLFSFMILIVIFLILNWVLIQQLYNMIFLLPDNVIGIIGRSGGAELGKDIEGKSYNLILGISRSISSGAVRFAAGSGIEKDKPQAGGAPGGERVPKSPTKGRD